METKQGLNKIIHLVNTNNKRKSGHYTPVLHGK